MRLTNAKRQAILTACRSSWQIDDFVRLTAAAKAALVAAALLTQARADAIFAAPF